YIDAFPAYFLVDSLYQRLIEQRLKVIFARTRQGTVGGHGYGGVALGLGNQGLLAEAVARAQFRELDAFLVQRRLARHDAFAGDDHVEEVALGALFDDDIAGAVVDALHAHEDGLDVRRRDAVKRLGLQQRRHPIARDIHAVAAQLRPFVLTGL